MEYEENGPLRNWRPDRVSEHRSAFTLVELLVVLAVMALLLGLATMRIGAASDRSAVRAAASSTAAVFTAARNAAIYRRAAVAITIDTVEGTVRAYTDSVIVYRRNLHATLGVRLTVSRDSMAFDSRGLGIGVANLSVVIRRGAATETLFVSRLGRVRY